MRGLGSSAQHQGGQRNIRCDSPPRPAGRALCASCRLGSYIPLLLVLCSRAARLLHAPSRCSTPRQGLRRVASQTHGCPKDSCRGGSCISGPPQLVVGTTGRTPENERLARRSAARHAVWGLRFCRISPVMHLFPVEEPYRSGDRHIIAVEAARSRCVRPSRDIAASRTHCCTCSGHRQITPFLLRHGIVRRTYSPIDVAGHTWTVHLCRVQLSAWNSTGANTDLQRW